MVWQLCGGDNDESDISIGDTSSDGGNKKYYVKCEKWCVCFF